MEKAVLDLRGEGCPGPVIKTLKKLAELPDGAELLVLMTSYECAVILISNLAAAKLGKARVEREGELIKMYITKSKA